MLEHVFLARKYLRHFPDLKEIAEVVRGELGECPAFEKAISLGVDLGVFVGLTEKECRHVLHMAEVRQNKIKIHNDREGVGRGVLHPDKSVEQMYAVHGEVYTLARVKKDLEIRDARNRTIMAKMHVGQL